MEYHSVMYCRAWWDYILTER